jgi:hypothetical protein
MKALIYLLIGMSQLVLVETQGKQVILKQWRPAEKSWRVIELPPDLVLPIAQGYGLYRVGALVELDRLEKKQGGLILVGLQEALGAVIDDTWADLRWWDRLRLWVLAGGRSETVQFDQVVAMTEIRGPDGAVTWQVSEADMDKFSSRFLADEAVRAEGIKVAILNATGRTGLARRVARIATNMGLVVVKLGEAAPAQKSKLLVSREKRQSISVRKISRLLAIERPEVGDASEYRADAVVFVGADYGLKVGE